MKKNVIIILSILSLVLTVVIGISVFDVCYFDYVETWRYNISFDECEYDLEVVRKYVYDNFKEETLLSVSRNADNGKIGLYSLNNNDHVDLSDEVETSLSVINDKGFVCKDAVFDSINVENGRIAFCLLNGQYALVWSPKEEPIGLSDSGDGVRTKIKKINSEWYHVVRVVD